jgi:hypothetical protein
LNSGSYTGRARIRQKHYRIGRETILWTCEHIRHRLRIIDSALKVPEATKFTPAVDAAYRMLRDRARRLIGVDPQDQSALGLRAGAIQGQRQNAS